MKTSLIVFNNGKEPIVVSDEEMVKGDSLYYSVTNIVLKNYDGNTPSRKEDFKIIAQGFSQIDFNGLESEFGVVDVEKLMAKWVMNPKEHLWVKDFFKAAQQLKRFSEEDMRKMYDMSCGNIGLGKLHDQTENNERFNSFIQSLQQPKIFEIRVEVETELDAYYRNGVGGGGNPIFKNGKLKILKKL